MQLHKATNIEGIHNSRAKKKKKRYQIWKLMLVNMLMEKKKKHISNNFFSQSFSLKNLSTFGMEFRIRTKIFFFSLPKSFYSKEWKWEHHIHILLCSHTNITSYFVSKLSTKGTWKCQLCVCKISGNAFDCVKICYVKSSWISFSCVKQMQQKKKCVLSKN